MKKFHLGLFLLLTGLFLACNEDTFNDDQKPAAPPSELAYAQTINAYVGAGFNSGTPSVKTYGADPVFSIAGGSSKGEALSAELLNQFSIVDTTGIIKVETGNTLVAQPYSLDIKVQTTHGETLFPKGYEVEILPLP